MTNDYANLQDLSDDYWVKIFHYHMVIMAQLLVGDILTVSQ